MARKKLPGEPPPDRPFGQEWPRDRQPRAFPKPPEPKPIARTQSASARMRRFVWRRVVWPLILWSKGLIRRACDELLVFFLKATALVAIVGIAGGSIIALQNYSLRQIVDTVIATASKQHGIETGSISPRQPTAEPDLQSPISPPTIQRRQAATKRRQTPEKPFFDALIDRIDEALGWKAP